MEHLAQGKILTLGTDLTVGNKRSYFMNLNTNLSKIINSGTVRINLYDEFQGRRMLLGSQVYPFIYEEQANKPDSQ